MTSSNERVLFERVVSGRLTQGPLTEDVGTPRLEETRSMVVGVEEVGVVMSSNDDDQHSKVNDDSFENFGERQKNFFENRWPCSNLSDFPRSSDEVTTKIFLEEIAERRRSEIDHI